MQSGTYYGQPWNATDSTIVNVAPPAPIPGDPQINKVIYGETVLIDITDTTATAADVAYGKYFYNALGNKIQGTYTPTGITLQEKTVTPTQTTQSVEPDSGYDALLSVTVNPIPQNYGLITWNGTVLTVS